MNTKIIIGNWKMNLSYTNSLALAEALGDRAVPDTVTVAVCPSFPVLNAVRERLPSGIALGAQDCASEDTGAYTGAVSPAMLAEIGVRYVLVGHSERRRYFAEEDDMIARKVAAVQRHGMVPVLCVGETAAERDRGAADERVAVQVRAGSAERDPVAPLIIAYEPVWAIGSGKPVDPDEAERMCAHIRKTLDTDHLPVLYGGSTNKDNAAEFLNNEAVSGLLPGGASLRADEFLAMITAAAV